ncbi:MAG: hypothetical protein IPP90_10200 [Gemmatimonadaceae bacterium]|nr:hypothetical protein [Gemmatimonadaceae bacterium]
MTIGQRVRHATKAAIALSALLAPGAAHAQVVRDSAGVRIVFSDKPSWTPAQHLYVGTVPSLTIGDRDGDAYLLSRVKGAARLSDGRMVLPAGAATSFGSSMPTVRTSSRLVARATGPETFAAFGA